jgi:AcrR family transcriptional regulator
MSQNTNLIPRVSATLSSVNNTVAPVTPEPADGQAPIDGRRSRWDAHRVTRRSELIDAAIKAIISSGADVGMDEIAAIAKTSKPVIYRYFADKPELHRAVTERIIGNVMTTLTAVIAADPPPQELIHASVEAYLALLEHNPELYLFVMAHPQVEDSSDFAHLVAGLLGRQLALHLERGNLEPALAHPWGEAIVGFINSASLWWLDHRDLMTRAQLADYLSALLWGGAAGVYQAVGQPADPRPGPGVFPRIT